MRTEILLDYEKSPNDEAYVIRALLRVHGDPPTNEKRVPLNVGIVLDRSGSMSGEPLAQAKEAAALLVRRLAPEDVVSVVAYDDTIQTIAEPASGAAQHDLVSRIKSIRTGGCTNLSGGWLRGRDLVAGSRRDSATHRLLLLTDGLANAGITDSTQLVGLCARAREDGIVTTTIGFGEQYDEVLLRGIAEAGGGSMYYIEHPDQAPAVFAEEIEGLLSLSAQNLSIEIRPAGAAQLSAVHHGYPRQPLPDGMRLELGDRYARDPRLLLAEFLVYVDDPGAEVDIAEVALTAHVVTGKGGIERQEIRLPIRASLAGGPHVDPEVRRELLLQEAARARKEAYEAQRRGDFGQGRDRLEDAASSLRALALEDLEVAEEMEDLTLMASRFDEDTMSPADAKYLYQRGYARSMNQAKTSRAIARAGKAGASDGAGDAGESGKAGGRGWWARQARWVRRTD